MFTIVRIGLGLTLVATTASSSRADALFNIWVEAPEQVNAGGSFTASVWTEVSGSVLNEGDGAIAHVSTDILSSGLNVDFSPATFPTMGRVSAGTPGANALRWVEGVNLLFSDGFESNPYHLFDVQVTTSKASYGTLEISPEARDGEDFLLAWWVDWSQGTSILDTDPGSSRIITPATVRVVPSSGGVAVLSLAGLAAARRRR